MSNITNTNPMVLDTAAAVVTNTLYITGIRWVPGTGRDVDDTAVISDKNGNVLWADSIDDIGAANNVIIQPRQSHFTYPIKAAGLTVTTLSGGKIYVYHKATRNG